MGKKWKQWYTLFSWAPKSLWIVTAAIKLKYACSLKNYDKPRQCTKKWRHYFADRGLSSQSYGFSSSHVWMWELNHKKAEHQRIDAIESCCWKGLFESPLDKEIKTVNPKGNQSWIFFERTNAEAETPILLPPDANNWLLLGKDPDAGKDWRQEKWTTEDEMVGWHHRHNGHEFEQAVRAGDRQGSLECCSLWGHKELDTTEWMNWTELNTWESHRKTE